MLQLVYDGTMAGLLTAIFEAYERRAPDVMIVRREAALADAFAQRVTIPTNAVKARRVWVGLSKKLSAAALEGLYYCYLSGLPEAEGHILAFVRYVFAQPDRKVEEDFGHPAVLGISQTAKKVGREKHRMEAFVRFQELGDGMYYAAIEPDYDVLPLIAPHFKTRYADQSWLIYDLRRKLGLHYDSSAEALTEVRLEWVRGGRHMPDANRLSPREELYQILWKDYFKSTGIPARRNEKLHLRHMPLRYWRYLTEKWY